jgi:hypothetical protein
VMANIWLVPRRISAPEALGAMVCLVTLSTPPEALVGLNTAANVAIEVLPYCVLVLETANSNVKHVSGGLIQMTHPNS